MNLLQSGPEIISGADPMSMWSSRELSPWLAALREGEIVVAPAEGVYGYCADPFNSRALEKILQIKRRSLTKGLIVLISKLSQLDQLSPGSLPEQYRSAVSAYWPGAVTLILPALSSLPDILTGGLATVAVRLPSSPYMLEYLEAHGGPLCSTSLNPSGEPPAIVPNQISRGIPCLTLSEPLSGSVSRIFNPAAHSWLR
jgi:L-threonylcarbamoyladenylate synthase